MAVLGPEGEWKKAPEAPAPQSAPRGAPGRKPIETGYARRLLAQQRANQAQQVNDLQAQMLYSPVIARAEGLIPAAELAQAGFDTSTRPEGMAMGINPQRLTPVQLAMLSDMMRKGGR